jgi:Leucine-rich repeat (LRR) protein
VVGGWRRLHSGELHNLYASQNNIRTIKPKNMRWSEPVARMEEMRNLCKIVV